MLNTPQDDLRSDDRTLIESLIEALPEATIAISAVDRIIAVNQAAIALFPALRAGDLLARVLRTPDVLDTVKRVRVLKKPQRATWVERMPVERLFDVYVAPITVVSLEGSMIISLHDLTEARRVERMRADFIANASHELRTPLSSLLGFIETLQGPAKDDENARIRFLGIMRDQARRMARLIDDLLSLSRIEQNLHVRPQAPVDLALVLRHVVETLTPMAHDNHVMLNLDSPDSLIVRGDYDELLRVVENLVENAIKYGLPVSHNHKPEIVITLAKRSRNAIMSVRDFGPGIASEHLPRLTERFYRVDNRQSRDKGGTGLGLAIVKHILARHQGRLGIDSRLGEGSTFNVALPLHED
ncbi:ATP-binding protein [Beijerinckia indica]|uniref:histidine kinase n=1 Tax=Beijerinckia indica subsp. indica (strain ATCC 9039 / DSM 1715 / NCIMB 8712) TaxID=395963 RepID=B2ICZ1_BEII9|nr:ATP-binding protein [Beijerinckia indica]ACB96756.1 histidine kinase [Beijerinckia indica subsp. indica ATCC 9039]